MLRYTNLNIGSSLCLCIGRSIIKEACWPTNGTKDSIRRAFIFLVAPDQTNAPSRQGVGIYVADRSIDREKRTSKQQLTIESFNRVLLFGSFFLFNHDALD